ncbi:hypothetical protein XU06_30270 (plasmid) [Rhodococcus erythropolis]|uniref:amidohydrolase family protein n=1 Tax=Rhodococcus erythropolis TaxID=1833 RepID=UPI00061B8383|nr:amidohydrolase family protein [Rhodococcus erythropolis]AKE01216.1 hypothetical protein XU06_30270 [Rhodococcus erythropolis]
MTRIDVHHHAIPRFYKEWLVDKGITAAGLQIPDWSVSTAREIMAQHDISTSILSISTPGVHLGDDAEARRVAREVNENVAEVVKDDPASFGQFASLPIPDVDGSLAEIGRAYDELGVDGVILLANTNGVYVGDPSLDPILDELNRREAVVFIHPSSLPAAPTPGVPPYLCDFLLDTTRAAVNLVRRGCHLRYPRIRFILAHAGGFLPFAAHRIAFTNGLDGTPATPGEVLDGLRTFYFDVAQSSTDTALAALLSFSNVDRVMYGSDYPHVSAAGVDYFARTFADLNLCETDREAISFRTAGTLFPRLATAAVTA